MSTVGTYRAITFDVGGTLIDPWPSVGHVYAAVALEVGLPAFDPASLNARFGLAWRAKSNFDYSRAAWAELVTHTFGGSAAEFGLATPVFDRLYDRFSDSAVWKVYEDVLPTLEALSQQGLALAAVSNWDTRLRLLLRNLKLDSHFHDIQVSTESGFHKPAPEIFRRAIRALGMRPADVLHVGDSLRDDFQGARQAGLGSILLKRNQPARKPDEIGGLLELLARINRQGGAAAPDQAR